MDPHVASCSGILQVRDKTKPRTCISDKQCRTAGFHPRARLLGLRSESLCTQASFPSRPAFSLFSFSKVTSAASSAQQSPCKSCRDGFDGWCFETLHRQLGSGLSETAAVMHSIAVRESLILSPVRLFTSSSLEIPRVFALLSVTGDRILLAHLLTLINRCFSLSASSLQSAFSPHNRLATFSGTTLTMWGKQGLSKAACWMTGRF
jgi:hypothetical protein